ncbi:High-affinity branched-chain amino acid transport ATP-binding protein LivF [Koleobacter methoxysyntrophicus]|jgi:branched-chain amino acid transport system ATP-binding protein|uniref:High-affinity branched-chain amino acid transport ATP-binding protein LivF n=1 Tax=Koleobacter methoxysyntrophicus TaxID=2751313 RepID=A0A8A0RNB5_9FIRM|nr:ABC transporter ATP-binding protein [Koleobacter methoxysyntrophicus]QSQ09372.1 High-affinity branched-chain amino acid transport ATP-binding protein LivF [Koleobacter methoxysyntrophicus]
MLRVKDLNIRYGGIHAVKGISFDVPQGEIITMVGANGAGKSSTLRAICGLVKPDRGSVITFMDRDLTSLDTAEIVRQGITMVPEGRRVFPDLTVRENLILGAYFRKDDKEVEKDIEWVYELFPRLRERKEQLAGTLSGGEQQMLAVGRALMSRPKLLMMDEPSLGLAPLLVKEIFEIIKDIHRQGVTILLIEQNARMALQIAHYGYVLETGSIVLEGTGEELAGSEMVKKAYLGE